MNNIIALNCDEIQVSDCDHLFLSGYSWSKHKRTGYYCCSNRDTWDGHQVHAKPIHWFVAKLMGLEIPKGFEIDHIDRNTSNNQRPNLRAASKELQQYNSNIQSNNTFGYTGVFYGKKSTTNPYIAKIRINGKEKYLGKFKTPEEASKVYQAAKKLRDDKEIKKCKEIING